MVIAERRPRAPHAAALLLGTPRPTPSGRAAATWPANFGRSARAGRRLQRDRRRGRARPSSSATRTEGRAFRRLHRHTAHADGSYVQGRIPGLRADLRPHPPSPTPPPASPRRVDGTAPPPPPPHASGRDSCGPSAPKLPAGPVCRAARPPGRAGDARTSTSWRPQPRPCRQRAADDRRIGRATGAGPAPRRHPPARRPLGDRAGASTVQRRRAAPTSAGRAAGRPARRPRPPTGTSGASVSSTTWRARRDATDSGARRAWPPPDTNRRGPAPGPAQPRRTPLAARPCSSPHTGRAPAERHLGAATTTRLIDGLGAILLFQHALDDALALERPAALDTTVLRTGGRRARPWSAQRPRPAWRARQTMFGGKPSSSASTRRRSRTRADRPHPTRAAPSPSVASAGSAPRGYLVDLSRPGGDCAPGGASGAASAPATRPAARRARASSWRGPDHRPPPAARPSTGPHAGRKSRARPAGPGPTGLSTAPPPAGSASARSGPAGIRERRSRAARTGPPA